MEESGKHPRGSCDLQAVRPLPVTPRQAARALDLPGGQQVPGSNPGTPIKRKPQLMLGFLICATVDTLDRRGRNPPIYGR